MSASPVVPTLAELAASSQAAAGRPECEHFKANACNRMHDPQHRAQFAHPCRFHPNCTRMHDPQHCLMFDHAPVRAPAGGDNGAAIAPRPCSFFLQGQCTNEDLDHLDKFSHGDWQRQTDPPAFAFDCEFIQVLDVEPVSGQPLDRYTRAPARGRAEAAYRWPVSIGVVDQRMETLLYARIRKPQGSVVHDDRFSRVGSGIRSDWAIGMSRRHATSMIVQLIQESGTDARRSALVGWDIAHDLEALGFEVAAAAVRQGDRSEIALRGEACAQGAPPAPHALDRSRTDQSVTSSADTVCDVVELQDYFRTAGGGAPMRLSEAFRAVFQRDPDAHDAVGDAKMTMELYIAWHRQGRPSVRYEMDRTEVVVTGVTPTHGLLYELVHPYDESTRSGVRQRDGAAGTGAMVVVDSGRLQINRSWHDGASPFFVRRSGTVLHLFDTEAHARAQPDLTGLQQVSGAEHLRLRVVCALHRCPGPPGSLGGGSSCPAYVDAPGRVLRQRVLRDRGGDGQTWLQVARGDGSEEALGWIGPVHKGRCQCLRLVWPFPLELHMFCLQYDKFEGELLSVMELLFELKPGPGLSNVSEELERDGAGRPSALRLRFRERSVRNAYWRTMQDTLKGRISFPQRGQTSLSDQDPWVRHPGTTLRVGGADGSPGGCLVHIWDQPR